MKKLIAALITAAFLILPCAGCNNNDDMSSRFGVTPTDYVSSDGGVSSFTDVPSVASTDDIEVNVKPSDPLDGIEGLSNEKKGFGQGPHVDSDNRPTDAVNLQEKFSKYDALFIAPKNDKIYLTFDEGYENGYTAKILDVLKEKKCSVVFFITMDYAKSNPELVKRMIDEGHVIGNHTVNHPSMPTVTIEKAKKEIMDLHEYILENYNYTMTLFRPPMGEYSERTLALTKNLGYKSMFWSFAYKDWETDKQPDTKTAFEKITKSAHGGAIYLLHAVSSTNTSILGDVIEDLRSKGFDVCAYS